MKNQMTERLVNCVNMPQKSPLRIPKVSETTTLVGRSSVSTPIDMPYKEMAGHCEALLEGKQQKMFTFVSAQQIQEDLITIYAHNKSRGKETPSCSHFQLDFSKEGNQFLDSNFNSGTRNPFVGTGPMLCATEYQNHAQFFQLPASCPYDAFLKAAGC